MTPLLMLEILASIIKFYSQNLTPLSTPGDPKEERIKQFKLEIVNYDIACLQEVFAFNDQVKQLRDSFISYARLNGFK